MMMESARAFHQKTEMGVLTQMRDVSRTSWLAVITSSADSRVEETSRAGS